MNFEWLKFWRWMSRPLINDEGVGEGGEVVWCGKSLRAVVFNRSASKLIVTFDHYSKNKSGFPACEASKLFTDQGFANLRLQTTGNDWYINKDTKKLAKAISNFAEPYSFRACLGYSMGGYAAFRFAQAVRADWIVAVSPQVSLAKSEAPGERRWTDARKNFDPVNGSLKPYANDHLRGMVVYDPMIRQDQFHALALQKLFPQLRLVPMSFAGHPATPLLADINRSGLVRQAALNPDFDPVECLRVYRRQRRGVVRYWENRKENLKDKKPHEAWAAKGALSVLQWQKGK